MYLSYIRIVNFRNLNDQKVRLDEGMNVFKGDNAQGKTSLMEAAACLSDGRSFRSARVMEMIRYEEKEAVVEGETVNDKGVFLLRILLNAKGRQYWLNRKEIQDLKEFIGTVNFAVISAEAMKISSGDPKARREFLDRGIYTMNPVYLFTLRDFRKLLRSRNMLLKGKNKDTDLMKVITDQMVSLGSRIVEQRVRFLKKIRPILTEAHKRISGNSEEMDLTYRSDFAGEALNADKIETSFHEALRRFKETETATGVTGAGPHRDDLEIRINGKDVRVYGSRGQKKNSVISLKLAELQLYRDTRGEYPVLVMDDMTAELDSTRQEALLEIIPGSVQVLLTQTGKGTELYGARKAKQFTIQSGNISEC
ncbi:DNA replication/repair protein RecF [bacterium]|nr:DNA replication/repair protein RecF [candidate division CSSED10-310 bacterium]